MGGELEDGTLTVGTGRDDANVGRVLDGGDDTGSEDNLLPGRLLAIDPLLRIVQGKFCLCSNIPGLANVDNVDTVTTSLPEVRLHVNLQVLASKVSLGREEHLNVLRSGVKDAGQVVRGHLVGL